MISRKHDKSADILALGVTMFILLTGEFPFVGRNAQKLFEDINESINQIDSLLLPDANKVSKKA